MNEKYSILIWISLKFVPKAPNVNMSVLVQEMAWRQTGDKPLLESMLIQFNACIMYAALGGDELKNVFENVICKILAIVLRPQHVKHCVVWNVFIESWDLWF